MDNATSTLRRTKLWNASTASWSTSTVIWPIAKEGSGSICSESRPCSIQSQLQHTRSTHTKDKDGRPTSTLIDLKPDSTSPCQTPREYQTRSYAPLKKSSMIQQTDQHLSATAELDFPQSGSKDDDETWLTEPTGCKTINPIKVAAEAINAAEACWVRNPVAVDPFRSHPKTQPVAEPDPFRITVPVVTTTSAAPCSTFGHGCDMPGPSPRMMMKTLHHSFWTWI